MNNFAIVLGLFTVGNSLAIAGFTCVIVGIIGAFISMGGKNFKLFRSAQLICCVGVFLVGSAMLKYAYDIAHQAHAIDAGVVFMLALGGYAAYSAVKDFLRIRKAK